MKKVLLSFISLCFCSTLVIAQTVATDFTANDCSGSSHHLFAELDAGKVIVISFIEPCIACIGPSQDAYNLVQTYASSAPGRVLFYLADDQANTPCSNMQSWANGNGMTSGLSIFSDSSVKESDYGIMAMPKLVVLAGTNHAIYYIGDDNTFGHPLQKIIDSALGTTGIGQVRTKELGLTLFPNPVHNKISISYTTTQSCNTNIDILNALGAPVKSISIEKQLPGYHENNILLDEKLPAGIYFLILNTTNQERQVLSFMIGN